VPDECYEDLRGWREVRDDVFLWDLVKRSGPNDE